MSSFVFTSPRSAFAVASFVVPPGAADVAALLSEDEAELSLVEELGEDAPGLVDVPDVHPLSTSAPAATTLMVVRLIFMVHISSGMPRASTGWTRRQRHGVVLAT
ncbi:MAG: hypothetical protein Q4P07_07855 [Ornithinimicrobium sp.]|uniref:hypothetical protein n=1 Tax=Ornithinimicrobium sp. TaxID=1977084 RepID=UPI0026DF087D|nr:hypothetical protein [Ornithinimicrobium sp.]MDO5740048.1 hypothetical protein [Ornithinimicrobium sp.]